MNLDILGLDILETIQCHSVPHPVVQLEGTEDTPSNLHKYMYMDKFILPNKEGNGEGGGEGERGRGGGGVERER